MLAIYTECRRAPRGCFRWTPTDLAVPSIRFGHEVIPMRKRPLIAMSLSASLLLAAAADARQSHPEKAPAPASAADKPICKRWAPIGSMVPTHKECHTRAEWDQIAANGRDQALAEGRNRVTTGALN